MKEKKSAKQLLIQLNRQKEEIYSRIRIYSEQKLDREVAYLREKENILTPIIWELELVAEYEKELEEKIKELKPNPVKP